MVSGGTSAFFLAFGSMAVCGSTVRSLAAVGIASAAVGSSCCCFEGPKSSLFATAF